MSRQSIHGKGLTDKVFKENGLAGDARGFPFAALFFLSISIVWNGRGQIGTFPGRGKARLSWGFPGLDGWGLTALAEAPGRAGWRLLRAQGGHGLDAGGAAAGQEGGGDGGAGEDQKDGEGGRWVGGGGSVEQSGYGAAQAETGDPTEGEAEGDGCDGLLEGRPIDAAAGGSEGHANADLGGAGVHGVAEGGVDAEEGEQEGGASEGGEEGGLDALGGEGVGELGVEGADGGDGDAGVDAPDGVAHGGGEEGGVLSAAYEEKGVVGRVVPIREIDHGDGGGAEGVVAGVGDDADDGVGGVVAGELAADGVLVWPDRAGGCLGDDGGLQGAVAGVEVATGEQVLLEGGEVSGADPAVVGEGGLAVVWSDG